MATVQISAKENEYEKERKYIKRYKGLKRSKNTLAYRGFVKITCGAPKRNDFNIKIEDRLTVFLYNSFFFKVKGVYRVRGARPPKSLFSGVYLDI